MDNHTVNHNSHAKQLFAATEILPIYLAPFTPEGNAALSALKVAHKHFEGLLFP